MISYNDLDQYILIKYLDKIVHWHKENEKENPYNNLILVNGDRPDVTFNRVLNCDKDVYKFFNNLNSIQKAAMLPKIELYHNTKSGYKLIKFRNYPDFEELRNFSTNVNTKFGFQDNEKQDGVGLKKITINDKNQNPGNINIECSIELFFDNILALTNSSILELIKTPEPRQSKDEKKFRLKLVAGWQTPVDASQTVFTPKELELIEKSNTVYLLSLVKHELNFNQNGSIFLTIYYQGALEKYLASSSDMDIFSTSSTAQLIKFLSDSPSNSAYLSSYIAETHNKILLESQIATLSKNKLTPSQSRQIDLSQSPTTEENKINDNIDDQIKDLEEKLTDCLKIISNIELFVIKDKYSKFIRALNSTNRIFFLPIIQDVYMGLAKNLFSKFWEPILDANLVTSYPQFANSTSNTEAFLQMRRQQDLISNQFLDKIKEAKEDSELSEIMTGFIEGYNHANVPRDIDGNATLPGRGRGPLPPRPVDSIKYRYITYTTLGDIINIARSFVYIDPSDNIEIIIGPIVIGNLSINIASFPIAISAFMVWFVNTVVRQAKRKYHFWEFIYDIINALLTPKLQAVGLIPKETVTLNITATPVISDNKLEKGKTYLDTEIYFFLSKNIFDINNIYSYLVLYGHDYEIDKRDGILEEDIKDGIYHYSLSKDRGIIKNIDFSKIDFPRMRDMRITTEGFNNVGDLLREHYNMNLKCVGSPLFIVGGQVYFDGAYLGESGRNITELLGLGGYYLVTGIESIFSPDSYEMDIKCLWTAMRKTSAEAYKIVAIGKSEESK